jgi:hypothetical protein
MGYIINGNGEKIAINNPDGYCAENVVLINDDTILVDKYIINIYKKQLYEKNSESEFITEILLDNEPTDEEIIFHMVQNGVNRYSGYVTIDKIKTLDFK